MCLQPPHPPYFSFIHELSFRPYALVESCLQSYSHTHVKILIFMSLSSHCVHMLSLLLCCCSQTGPFMAAQQQHPKSPPLRPPLHTQPSCPRSITHPSYARLNPQWPPSVTKLLLLGPLNGPCVTLGPLCLIRCYIQTTKGLPHRDPTLHLSLTQWGEFVRQQIKNPSMGTIRDASLSPRLVNYVKQCYGKTEIFLSMLSNQPHKGHSMLSVWCL